MSYKLTAGEQYKLIIDDYNLGAEAHDAKGGTTVKTWAPQSKIALKLI